VPFRHLWWTPRGFSVRVARFKGPVVAGLL